MLIQLIPILAQAAQQGEQNSFLREDLLKPFLLVGGILVVGLFLMVRTQRRAQRSRARGKLSAQERVEQMRGASDVYRQVNELMAALADLSRQINGQIDTRMAKLEILLRQADERLGRLEALNGGHDQREQQPRGQGQASLEQIAQTFHQSQTRQKNGGAMATRGTQHEPDTSGGDSALAREILDLSSQGLAPLDIARRLERPVGEVELVLSLHRK